MKEIIFGTTEFSEYVYYTMKAEHIEGIVAFTMSSDYLDKDSFCGLPVLPFEDLRTSISEDFEVIITVGYPKMNKGRIKVYQMCKDYNYNVGSFISKRAICDSNEIEEGCIIMPKVYVPPMTSLGVCNIVNVGSILGHTAKIGDFNWFSGNCVSGGNISIGNNCFFGMNSLIKNGVHVASNTLLGAYSYLCDDTGEGLFYTGNPALNMKKLKSQLVVDFI